MQDNPYREDRESIRELLQQFENLRNGRRPAFLEEESFEKIIDYFQEKEDLPKAREAVEMALEAQHLWLAGGDAGQAQGHQRCLGA